MKTRYIIAIAAVTMMFSGCQRELLPESDVNFGDGQIRYSVSNTGVKSSADELVSTASLSLVSGDGKVTVPVTCEVSEGIDLGNVSAETKGALINTSGEVISLPEGNKFTVSAYKGSTPQFIKKTATNSGDYWTMDPPQYWPLSTKLTFFAFANTDASNVNVNADATAQTLTYSVPSAAAAHQDILLGFYEGNGGNNGIAEIHFDHPLTAVCFKQGEMTGVTGIRSITISGLASGGSVTMNAEGVTGNWTVSGTEEYKTAATLSGGESTLAVDGTTKLIGKDSEGNYNGAFLLVPQTLSDHKVTVTAVLATADGDVTVYADITSGTWLAGYTNTYTLGYTGGEPEVNWLDLGIKADNGNTLLWCDRNVVAIDENGVATLADDIYTYNSVENAGLFKYSKAMTITSAIGQPKGMKGRVRLATSDEWKRMKDLGGSFVAGETTNGWKIEANGTSIFFPAAGYIENASLSYQGSKGRYSTSTTGTTNLYRFSYSSSGTDVNNGESIDSHSNSIRLVFEVYPEMEFVDLGLPNGTLWATCNLGASKPEEYGNYYAWGETAGYNEKMVGDGANSGASYSPGTVKTNYSWDYYKWGSGENNLGKYVDKTGYGMTTPDGKTTLEPVDDAATANWGGDWRMPTTAEWQELYDNTTNSWDNNYNNTGVKGRVFTSKDGKGTTLFLPAAGYRSFASLSSEGSYGHYWSGSLKSSEPSCACYMYFHSDGVDPQNNYYRRIGYSVRPVRAAQ